MKSLGDRFIPKDTKPGELVVYSMGDPDFIAHCQEIDEMRNYCFRITHEDGGPYYCLNVFPEKRKWSEMHEYWIRASDIKNHMSLIGHIMHLTAKDWFTADHLHLFVEGVIKDKGWDTKKWEWSAWE